MHGIGSSNWKKPEATQAEKDLAQSKLDYFLSLRYIDESDIALAQANLESARVALQDAQAALDIVKAGPDALNAPIAALGTEMAKLEQARLLVENTRLTAPFDGEITSLNRSRWADGWHFPDHDRRHNRKIIGAFLSR